jgi:hypothetical protein
MQRTLFKSFTRLSVKRYDDFYRVIESNIQKTRKSASHNKRNREEELLEMAGRRRFKLNVKDRVIIITVLAYYLLYTSPIS